MVHYIILYKYIIGERIKEIYCTRTPIYNTNIYNTEMQLETINGYDKLQVFYW